MTRTALLVSAIVGLAASAFAADKPRPALAFNVECEDVKRFEADEAKKYARLFTEASAKLENPPLKVAPDVEKGTGLSAKKHVAFVVPDSALNLETLKKLDKEIVPLGLLYTHRMTLVVADQAVPAEKHRTIEVSAKDNKATIGVMHLGATRVAGQLVLLVWTNDKAPAVVTTLVETEDAKDHPLDLDAVKGGGDNQATLLLTVLGRYRAAISVAGLE